MLYKIRATILEISHLINNLQIWLLVGSIHAFEVILHEGIIGPLMGEELLYIKLKDLFSRSCMHG